MCTVDGAHMCYVRMCECVEVRSQCWVLSHSTHYYPLRQSFSLYWSSLICIAQLARQAPGTVLPQSLQLTSPWDRPASVSPAVCSRCARAHLAFIVGSVETKVLTLSWQAHKPLSHLSAPGGLYLKRQADSS